MSERKEVAKVSHFNYPILRAFYNQMGIKTTGFFKKFLINIGLLKDNIVDVEYEVNLAQINNAPIDSVYRIKLNGEWKYRTLEELSSHASSSQNEFIQKVHINARKYI